MPFNTATALPSSRVKVYLRGLLLIQPEENGSACDIGVQNRTDDHILQVSITSSSKERGGTKLLCHHVGKVKHALSHDITIRINRVTGTGAGVSAFKPTTGKFDRSKDNKDEDLQWAIDLQNGEEFHEEELSMIEGGTRPRISMSDGVFFTAERTNKKDLKIKREGGKKDPLPLDSIAKVIGVAFDLAAAGSRVAVRVREPNCDQTFLLPQADDPADTTYEVYIRNDPPRYYSELGHDELEQYYDVLLKDGRPVAPDERFTLRSVPGERSSYRAEESEKPPVRAEEVSAKEEKLITTDRIPCIPAIING